MRIMTDKEIRFFRASGYFKLDWSFDGGLMEQVKAKLDILLSQSAPPFQKDSKGNIVKLFDLFSRDQLFRDIYTSDLIIKPLQGLLGPNIEFLRNRHNHASIISQSGNEMRFHRDNLHWSRPAVSVAIYPQDTSEHNGCTWLIPCSQYFEFVAPSTSPLHGGTWLDEFSVYDGYEAQALPVMMEKGGILFFDSLVFHSPGINLSRNVRYAITAAYHASDELIKSEDHEDKILVSGERLYRGNELHWNY